MSRSIWPIFRGCGWRYLPIQQPMDEHLSQSGKIRVSERAPLRAALPSDEPLTVFIDGPAARLSGSAMRDGSSWARWLGGALSPLADEGRLSKDSAVHWHVKAKPAQRLRLGPIRMRVFDVVAIARLVLACSAPTATRRAFYERRSLPTPLRHAANSGAILQMMPDSFLDIVRPGVLMFGSSPAAGFAIRLDLKQAMRWITQVVFFKVVKAGSPVSYGSTWSAPADTPVITKIG